MNGHTPGPWSVYSFIEESDGYKVRRILAPNGCPLAVLQHTAEDGANARLIAAAPELFTAGVEAAGALMGAVKIMRELSHDRTATKLEAMLAPLMAAINKAAGA